MPLFLVREGQGSDSLVASLLEAVCTAMHYHVDIVGHDRPLWRSPDSTKTDDQFDLHVLSTLFERFSHQGLPGKFKIADGRVSILSDAEKLIDKSFQAKKAEYLKHIAELEEKVRSQARVISCFEAERA